VPEIDHKSDVVEGVYFVMCHIPIFNSMEGEVFVNVEATLPADGSLAKAITASPGTVFRPTALAHAVVRQGLAREDGMGISLLPQDPVVHVVVLILNVC